MLGPDADAEETLRAGLGLRAMPSFDELGADDIAQMQAVTGVASLDDLRSALTSASDLVEEHWRAVAPRYTG